MKYIIWFLSPTEYKIYAAFSNWHNRSISYWVKVAQSCLTVCDPGEYTVHGILQARILQWVKVKLVSHVRLWNPRECTVHGILQARILQGVKVKVKSLSCVWLFVTPMDYSLPGSFVFGIF